MATSKEFQGGITNGAQWYPLYGGMQDWNYMAADCMEVRSGPCCCLGFLLVGRGHTMFQGVEGRI